MNNINNPLNTLNTFINIFIMNHANNYKTGYPLLDYIIILFIVGISSFIIKNMCRYTTYEYLKSQIIDNTILDNIFYMFNKKSVVIIEGKVCFKTYGILRNGSEYIFSDRFRAIWYNIAKIINTHNNTNNAFNSGYNGNNNYTKNKINIIKEYASITTPSSADTNTNTTIVDESTMYIVCQNKQFLIDKKKEIYATVEFKNENFESKDKLIAKVEIIRLSLFSYTSRLEDITAYIEEQTDCYLTSLDKYRYKQLFIYELFDPDINAPLNAIWNEYRFESSRNFNNLFFTDKSKLLHKIDFFVNNKNWYYKHGIPYSLGIGLSGPPGTGKTSIIKAIANKLNRHIVIIPLSKIKTTKELCMHFFENRFSYQNKVNSISFDKKIIIFEDIDCMTDLILSRNNIINSPKSQATPNDNIPETTNKVLMNNMLSIMNGTNQTSDISNIIKKQIKDSDDKLTLSFILNLIDGIRETPGRILIITSNFYDQIDKALIRPGRIDITLNMTNANHNMIQGIYNNFYNKTLENADLQQIKEYVISPANLINICINSNDHTEFINKVIEASSK